MKTIFLLQIYFITTLSSAQITEIADKPLDVAVYLVNLNNTQYDGAEGSPYLDEDFLPAKINGNKETHFIRFDIMNNNIEVKVEGGKILLLDMKKDFFIKMLDGSKKIYKVKSCPGEDGKPFRVALEVVQVNDSYAMYLSKGKKLIPKKETAAYQEKVPAKFIEKGDIYYIDNFKSTSPDVLKLPKKKRKFSSFFDEDEKIEKYMKEEKMDIFQNEDFIKFFNFYFFNKP